MRLHYFAALVIFVGLLFGVAASADAQQKQAFFGSSRGLPTRLFGSTSNCECVDQCAQRCDNDCYSGCGQKDACGCGSKCEPACGTSQKSCDSGVSQKCVAQKSVVQKSVAQKCVPQKSVVQKSVAQKGDSDCCDRQCRPNPVVRALAKLDDAVKGLFRSKSDCCQPCYDVCCDTSKSCEGYGGKAGSSYDSMYDYGPGDLGLPEDFNTPSPYSDLEEPLLDGNPFEDDAVQPPPPMPSEARLPSRPRPLLGPVAAMEVTSPFRVQTPPRIGPVDAAPLQKTPQLAKSILDRGNSTTTRRYGDRQPSYRLTSAQAELSDR